MRVFRGPQKDRKETVFFDIICPMNEISLLAWAALASFALGATASFVILAPETKSFGLRRKIAGGIAIWVAAAVLLLPVLFVPALGLAGLVLSVIGVGLVALSYWRWWVLWLPAPGNLP